MQRNPFENLSVSGQTVRQKARTAGVVLCWLALSLATATATTFDWKGDSGGSGSWTNVGTSSIWQGNPATFPVFGDTVNIATLANTALAPDISLNLGWGASQMTVLATNTAARRRIFLSASGYVDTLILSNAISAASGGFQFLGSVTTISLTLRQWSDVGPVQTSLGFNANNSMLFTNNALITYGVAATNVFAGTIDFRGASSVELRKNTAATTQVEVIKNTVIGPQGVYIGRANNSNQTWTVSAGSHPLLLADGGRGMIKSGAGNAVMPDVDLGFNVTTDNNGIISTSGSPLAAPLPLYGGTISANSLEVDGTAATAARQFVIGGHLLLDGQGGLQAGGTGDGRAVSIITGNNDLTMRLSTAASSGNPAQANAGQLEIAPSGGDLFVSSTGTGKAILNINVKTADANNPVIIANTLDLASPNASISDTNLDGNGTTGNRGGTIQLRGSFLNQSTQAVAFSMARSTLLLTGGGALEAASADLGTGALLTNDFQISTLVLTNGATYQLQDLFHNDTGTGHEAVYVNNLYIWDHATLDLRGIDLYFRNGSNQWLSAVNYTNNNFTNFTAQFAAYGDGTGTLLDTPEPSVLFLLGIGGCLLARWRRR